MRKIVLALLSSSLLLGSLTAYATPEQDRKQILDFYKNKFPTVKFEDYIFGALALDKDAMEQYKSIMDFPPFEGVVDTGKKCGKRHSRMARPMPVAFLAGAKMWPGTILILMTS